MRKGRAIALTAGAGAITVALATGMAGLAGGAGAATAPAVTHTPAKAHGPVIVLKPGTHLVTSKATIAPPTTAQCEAAFHIACYTPNQIQRAYNTAPLYAKGITGRGETIVIVDAFGSPTIAADLHTFDKGAGIADPPSLKVIHPAGAIPKWDPNNSAMVNWGFETTLDVEYSHTIAPGANILLVETPASETEGTTGFPQIVTAENYVVNHHLGNVISQSFGATEETFTSYGQLAPLRSAYVNAAKNGITVLASTGDTGVAGTELDGSTFSTTRETGWPATDPLVTAVGGTQIKDNGGHFSQVTWNDTYDTNLLEAFTGSSTPAPFASTGGVSEFFRAPSWQHSVAGIVEKATGEPASKVQRAVPDISMSGACDGSVDVYLSFPGAFANNAAGWTLICGTSEASPEFAGIVALSDQVAHHSLGLIDARIYALEAAHAPGIVDVTSGNNTVTFTQGNPATTTTVQGYTAGKGYDLATGVGTVNAALFVPELAFGH